MDSSQRRRSIWRKLSSLMWMDDEPITVAVVQGVLMGGIPTVVACLATGTSIGAIATSFLVVMGLLLGWTGNVRFLHLPSKPGRLVIRSIVLFLFGMIGVPVSLILYYVLGPAADELVLLSPEPANGPEEGPRGSLVHVSCPAGMVFVRGRDTLAFCMDSMEVTVSSYDTCIEAGRCADVGPADACNSRHEERGQHPANCVSVENAREYCRWAGKRLPTPAEWLVGARGGEDRRFPWGTEDSPSCDRVIMTSDQGPGCGQYQTWPVGSRPEGDTPEGVMDMMGNVWEWTETDEASWIHGGGWKSQGDIIGVDAVDVALEEVGFRCVLGIATPEDG